MKVVKSLAACGMPTVSQALSLKVGIAPSSPLGSGAYTTGSFGFCTACLVYFHGRAPRLMSWRSDGATVTACAVIVAPRSTAASRLGSRPRPFALRCSIGCVFIGCGSPVRAAEGQRVLDTHDGTSRRSELPALLLSIHGESDEFSRPYAVCRRIIRLPDDSHNTLRSRCRDFRHH